MGEYQNVLLTVSIGHRKSHLIMMLFSEIWIQLHVFEKIMHPAHVPFQAESKSIVLRLSGHLRPRR